MDQLHPNTIGKPLYLFQVIMMRSSHEIALKCFASPGDSWTQWTFISLGRHAHSIKGKRKITSTKEKNKETTAIIGTWEEKPKAAFCISEARTFSEILCINMELKNMHTRSQGLLCGDTMLKLQNSNKSSCQCIIQKKKNPKNKTSKLSF